MIGIRLVDGWSKDADPNTAFAAIRVIGYLARLAVPRASG